MIRNLLSTVPAGGDHGVVVPGLIEVLDGGRIVGV